MKKNKTVKHKRKLTPNAVLPVVKLGKEKVTCEDCSGTGYGELPSKHEGDFIACETCDGTGKVNILE